MTVDELLRALSGAFRAFDAAALAAWAPAFRRRLARYDGPTLADAYVAVLANFRPGPRQAFPVPLDFEPHLPAGHPRAPARPVLDLAAHAERKARLIAGWRARQKPAIEQARGRTIAQACEWEAARLAHERAWSGKARDGVLLSAEEIELCERRAVSQWRLRHFSVAALKPGREAEWREQMEAVRAALYANQDTVEPEEVGSADEATTGAQQREVP